MSSRQPLRARPERSDNPFLLRDHLLNVQTKGEVILKQTAANSSYEKTDTYLDRATKSMLVRIITGSHDIGKASQFFQDYVNPPFRNTGMQKAHSQLSAVFAIFAAKKLLPNDSAASLAAFVAICVLAHHGQLESPSKSARKMYSMMNIVGDQIDSIKTLHLAEVDSICKSLGFPLFSEFETQWKNVFWQFVRAQGGTSYDRGDLGVYYAVNDLFSILIDADRLDAAELGIPHRLLLPTERVRANIMMIQEENSKKCDPKILKIRETVFSIVSSNAQKVAINQKLFSLTAPTGSGKTLTALSFALQLRERSKDRNSRIIYVAPFLSIIDQNLKVFKEALGQLSERSDVILAHHHLCELNYRDESTEEYSTGQSILLIEGWNSEIIVTTFIQFLYTILGRGSKELRKLHNIAGSIVLLDEVQAIPIEYWRLVRKALTYLSAFYNVTFVLMTATQPLIFDKRETIELVDNYREYFDEPNTTLDLSALKDPSRTQSAQKTIPQFAKWVEGYTRGRGANQNLMIVVNTVGCATGLHDLLTKIELGHTVQYLSAEVTPKERRERLNSIIEQMKKNRECPVDSKPVLLVTTQLVEAGVDIDFDLVVRDIAPMDSIIQSAGRCNRNGNKPREESVVTVVDLVDEDGNSFARKVYGNISIEKTHRILTEADLSRSFQELSDMYYLRVSEARSERIEEDIFKGIAALDYEKLDDFKLIEEKPGGSVFIELDDYAVYLFNTYKEIWTQENHRGSATREFLKIRSDFYQYVVNIPKQYLSQLGEPIFGIYHVGRDSLPDMYSETGFIRNPSGVV